MEIKRLSTDYEKRIHKDGKDYLKAHLDICLLFLGVSIPLILLFTGKLNPVIKFVSSIFG